MHLVAISRFCTATLSHVKSGLRLILILLKLLKNYLFDEKFENFLGYRIGSEGATVDPIFS